MEAKNIDSWHVEEPQINKAWCLVDHVIQTCNYQIEVSHQFTWISSWCRQAKSQNHMRSHWGLASSLNSSFTLMQACVLFCEGSCHYQHHSSMPEWPLQVLFRSHVSGTRQNMSFFSCTLFWCSGDVTSFYQNLYGMAFMDCVLSKAKWQQQAAAILWVFLWQ